jgi:hypothetical protein
MEPNMKKSLGGFPSFLTLTFIVLAATALSARAADNPFIRYVPEGTTGVALVDVAKILASKPAKDIVGNKSPVSYFTDKVFEQQRDDFVAQLWAKSKFPKLLDSVVENTARAQWIFVHAHDVVIVLEGKYNARDLSQDFKEAVLSLSAPYTVDAFGNQHELASFGDKKFCVTVLSNTQLMFGDRPALEAILSRLDNKTPAMLDKRLADALAELSPEHAMVGAMLEGPHGAAATQPGAADLTNVISGTFDVDDQSVRGLVAMVLPNEVAAAGAESAVTRELQKTDANFGHSPRALPVVKLLKDAKIARNGKKLTIEMTLPGESTAAALSVFFNPPSDIEPEMELTGLPNDTRGIALSSDGKLAAAAGNSNSVHNAPPDSETETLIVWDTATRQPVFEQNFKAKGLNLSFEGLTVRFGPANQRLAVSAPPRSYGEAGEIVLYDLAAKREANRLEGRDGIFSPDGHYFAYHAGRGIEIIDAKAWQELRLIREANDAHELEFSPDSRNIAAIAIAAYEPKQITIWNAQTGEKADTIALDPQKPLLRFAWSPDGRSLAIAANDGTVHLIDRATHRQTQEFDLFGTYPEITAIAFVNDGAKLAVATRSMTKLIDLHGGENLVLRTPRSAFHTDLSYNPASHLLAVGGGHGVYVWRLPAH